MLTLDAAPSDIKPDVAPVKIKKKRASKHDFKDGRGRVFAHKHVNGLGWVEDSAKVEDSVFVSRMAQVMNGATIRGNVKIQNRARVCGFADIVADRTCIEICNFAVVGGVAVLRDSVRVLGHAEVYNGLLCGSTVVNHKAVIFHHSRGQPYIRNASIRDNAKVYDNVTLIDTTLEGVAKAGGNAKISNSVLHGCVSVGGFARLVNTTLRQLNHFYPNIHENEQNDELNRLRVVDHVVLCDCEISGLLEFAGHAKALGCTLHFSPVHDAGNYVRERTHDQALFAGLRINNVATFQSYNVSPHERPAMGSQPARPLNRPVDTRVLAPGRRIMATSGSAN
jgi:carbonic anhydrase/acetyltransferase-like protein (isoleucine patch superfamily)